MVVESIEYKWTQNNSEKIGSTILLKDNDIFKVITHTNYIFFEGNLEDAKNELNKFINHMELYFSIERLNHAYSEVG